MARPRRRIKFQPFRMGEKFRNTILVGLGVFLMAIFAVPFQGSCQRQRGGGRDPNEVYVTYDGRDIRYGEVLEVRRLCSLIYRGRQQPTDDDAVLWLIESQEAERAGIRVSDEEVIDAIRNERFPRRLRVDYVIADSSAFGKDLPVSDKEVEEAYQKQKDTRFRKADKTVQPLSEVRELLLAELRERKGSAKAKAALEELKRAVDRLVGAALENGLKELVTEREEAGGKEKDASPAAPKLQFGETKGLFTAREAGDMLYEIGGAPGITKRVFSQPLGEVSEPLPLVGKWCVFRVVSRSRGFGPDGVFYPEEEGWVRRGFGVINIKDYEEAVRDLGVTQAELEATERQRLALEVLPGLVGGSMTSVPWATVRARYVRDSTQAVAAYFTIRASDFAPGITPTDNELRDFYARHKDMLRTATRPGYRQPERVAIEYVLGRSSEVASCFGPAFAAAREDVRERLAEGRLVAIIGKIANRAADAATRGRVPDLSALTAGEAGEFAKAFIVATTPPFAASEAAELVSDLGGANLPEILFGDRGQQYAVAGTEAKPGTHAISDVFPCRAGRFFFRVVQKEPSREIPYDNLPDHLRRQLANDVKNDKAFAKAKETAGDYRKKVSQAAIERFAERVGTKPLETEFLKPADPFPGLGKAVPELYAQLASADVGELSDLVDVGERFVLARLIAREEAKGHRFQLVACAAQGLSPTFEPSLYEQRAAYAAAPYGYLDPPKPIAFDKVKDDIAKLLARRQALTVATERIEKALAAMHETPKPEVSAVALKHGLRPLANVAVDLAAPEATPNIGKAAGFRDAVTALKPGDLSNKLSSAEGRFFFVLKSRDEETATIDVAAALYDTLRAEAKIDDKEVRQYYDEHRDSAYVTDDEIEDAPPWDSARPAAQERVRSKLRDEWAKKPLAERLGALRDSLVYEAFRTVPSAAQFVAVREMEVTTDTVGPFPLSRPDASVAEEAELLAAVRSLKAGEVTKPLGLTKRPGVVIALLAERRPGGLARAKVAMFSAADFMGGVSEPDAAAVERHYKANKAAFRVPAQATLEFVFADLASRQQAAERALSDAEVIRHYQWHADDLYRGHSYEECEYLVRADLARERATRDARAAAEQALEGARKVRPGQGDLAALAKKLGLTWGKTDPFAIEDPASPTTLGRVVDIADVLGDAKAGDLLPRIVASSHGYAVCRLVARTAPRDAELADVRNKVTQTLKRQAACAAALKAAETFRAAAAASSFDKAASQAKGAHKVVETELLDARSFALPGEGAAPAIADAVFALDKPGLTPAVAEAESGAAFFAQVIERQPDELVTLEIAAVDVREPILALEQATDADLKAHYDANQENFRRPDAAKVESLAAPYGDLIKALPAPSDDELKKEYDRSVAAREYLCRDPKATVQPAFLSFDAAKERVREHLLRAKARAEAGKRLAEAMSALRAEGAKADLKAYAAKHPPLVASQSGRIDRKSNRLAGIGYAPDLAEVVFAARKGDLAGPVQGLDGACVLRITDLELTRIPPLGEIKFEVQMDWERARMVQRMVAAAGKVHDALVAAVAKAGEKDRAEAFRKAAEGAPRTAEVPHPIPVVLSRPFRPLDLYDLQRPDGVQRAKQQAWRSLMRLDLIPAVFRQRPARMTPVVEDEERTECYVALPTEFIPPKEPTRSDLLFTKSRLYDMNYRMALDSWRRYLESRMERD